MEIETSLINAYACCANLFAAECLFKEMKSSDIDNSMYFVGNIYLYHKYSYMLLVAWNAMLKAYLILHVHWIACF